MARSEISEPSRCSGRQIFLRYLVPLVFACSLPAAPTTIVPWGERNSGAIIPGNLTNVIRIVSGINHPIGLKADGTIVGWGDAFTGEAAVISSVTDAKAVSLGA